MSDNTFETPWSSNDVTNENFPENPVICEAICQLEHLLRQREKLCCPNDDIDTEILSAIRCVVNSIKHLMEQQDLMETHKLVLIRKSRLLIQEANNIIEKTLKIRSH